MQDRGQAMTGFNTTEMAVPLPQRPEIERAILGAVLVDDTALTRTCEVLSVGDFSVAAHRSIFSAMQSLAAGAKPVDIHMLWDLLRDDSEVINAGGAAFIASLGDGIHRNAPVADWGRMVHEAAILRKIAHAGESLSLAAIEPHAKAEEMAKQVQALASSLANSLRGSVLGVLASEVEPKHVEWLWNYRIPLGKITVLDGDPGLGKSALSLDLAARTTNGRPMPDGSPGIKTGVLILSAEDDPADTIVPRLSAMGANLNCVKILTMIPDAQGQRQLEIPLDLSNIERAAESVGAKLVIIDPLMAFLAGSTNSFRDQDIRRALAPLAAMAERLGAAVLIVRHLNKNVEGNPLYRGGGSIGIIGAARSGLLVAPDPDDESGVSRILASSKSNLGPSPVSLRYSIEPHDGSIRVGWLGESPHRAADLLTMHGGEKRPCAVDEAAEFLRAILEEGSLPTSDVLRKGEAAGFSRRTIQRAKTVTGIVAKHRGFGPGSIWVWELPTKNANEEAKSAATQELASFEEAVDSTSIKSSSSSKDAKQEELACFVPDHDESEEPL